MRWGSVSIFGLIQFIQIIIVTNVIMDTEFWPSTLWLPSGVNYFDLYGIYYVYCFLYLFCPCDNISCSFLLISTTGLYCLLYNFVWFLQLVTGSQLSNSLRENSCRACRNPWLSQRPELTCWYCGNPAGTWLFWYLIGNFYLSFSKLHQIWCMRSPSRFSCTYCLEKLLPPMLGWG